MEAAKQTIIKSEVKSRARLFNGDLALYPELVLTIQTESETTVRAYHMLPSYVAYNFFGPGIQGSATLDYDTFFIKHMGMSPEQLEAPREVETIPTRIVKTENDATVVLIHGRNYTMPDLAHGQWVTYDAVNDLFWVPGNWWDPIPRHTTPYAGRSVMGHEAQVGHELVAVLVKNSYGYGKIVQIMALYQDMLIWMAEAKKQANITAGLWLDIKNDYKRRMYDLIGQHNKSTAISFFRQLDKLGS